ncbi:alpha/beta hydrolase [Planomonospora sp. ID91781]|uniref:Alpha/beta hydrolase n=1 Tax=Planomonospora sphaerica TaxID=161355 RepID=A0A171DQF9_9ACTN|nr:MULTISPECIES: alpha/beta hydrolase [Planomonospora]MBG0823275.1 alpha/beta hydrolase [Planomonospora sp. ID91781]GAT71301.1 alpha/beta hydrolase [Planomonospora sphaerica]
MVRLDTLRSSTGQPVRQRRRRRLPAVATALLLAAVLFGAYGWQPAEDGRAFRSPYLAQAGSRYADTPIARFHYVQAGSGSPVILLSPGGTSVIGWKEQVAALARDHTVYVVDLPGQGYTRLKDADFAFDLEAMTSAVGAFLDAVGVRRAALAGNSWSGGWALAFAQRHPERVSRLALLDATGLDLPGTWMWESLKIPVVGELAVKLSTGKSTVRGLVEGMMVNKWRLTDRLLDEWWAPMTFHDNIRATYLLERRLDWAQTERALPSTATPALVLWGAQDTVQPVERARRFAELLPDARLQILDGCGHVPQLDCPEPVNRHLQAFFADS